MFKNENGDFDFTKADGYQEDLTRFNINKVIRDRFTKVIKPTPQREVIVINKADY